VKWGWVLVWRIRSNFICIFDVPVTGRITAWTESARAGGSTAFWQTNAFSWSVAGAGVVVAVAAVVEPSAIAHTATAPTPRKRGENMRKYQQIAAVKVAASSCDQVTV
jgi:hypothetical protein